MKKYRSSFQYSTLLMILFFTITSFEFSRDRSDKKEKKRIKEVILKLDNALIERDFDVLNKYYDDGLKLIAPNGLVLDKGQVLLPFKDSNKKSALRKIERSKVDILIREKYAYVVMKTTHSFEGIQSRVYENLLIFTSKDSEWKLKLMHSSFR